MDRIISNLPSPAGLTLWLYALCFVVLPALLAWAGFAYVLGIVIFAIGLKPHVSHLAETKALHFALRLNGAQRETVVPAPVRNEARVVRLVSWGLLALTILGLPLLLYVVQSQGQVFYAQLDARLPALVEQLGRLLNHAHDLFPDHVPEVEVENGAGWEGLQAILNQLAGEAVQDVQSVVRQIFGGAISVAGTLLGDWAKLVIGALIVGTILAGYDKEAEMHRGIISRGIRNERLRRNTLRFGELYQSGVSLFMIGYLQVAATLTMLYAIAMVVLPFGIGLGGILFMSVLLGIVTAIPKIGGLLGMAVAVLLMVLRLEPGLGWFGWNMISFGWGADVAIRTVALVAVAKFMGLLEAYNYTPEIVGRKLGMTKMQIIATIVIWAVGAGVFGMIWGILLSLTFQAALRLAEEDAAERAETEASALRGASAPAE